MAVLKSQLAIHAAQVSCISHCLGTDAPLAFLRDFLDQLENSGWHDEDISALAAEVFPILLERRSVGQIDAGDATAAR
jgi:hypothetical protein